MISFDTTVNVIGAKEELLKSWLCEPVVIPKTRVRSGWDAPTVGSNFGRVLLFGFSVNSPTSLSRIMLKTGNMP